jgi:hypothetical protein
MKHLHSLVGAMLLTPGVALAAPACVSASYSTYTAIGFECEINGAVFSNFTYPATPNGGDLLAGDITVSPLSTLNSVGLRFTAAFSASGLPNGPGNFEGQFVEQYRFIYQVFLPAGVFVSATTNINGGSVFSPNAQKPSGYLAAMSVANDGASAIVGNNTPGQTETNALFTARANITADTLAQLTGGASAVGTAAPVGIGEYDSFDNVFQYRTADVPEPQTAAMIVLALAAGVRAARFRRKPSGAIGS